MKTAPEELNVDEILQEVLDASRKKKGYASFFDWPEKKVKERGIVRDFVESLNAETEIKNFRHVRSMEMEPPDCEIVDSSGKRIGIELTELVDEQTINEHRNGQGEWKEWSRAELVAKIEIILVKKDGRKFQGESYYKKLLLIHTDEPWLRAEFDDWKEFLSEHYFQRLAQLDEVYFLFSYEPGRKTCPYIQLNFT